MKGFFLPFVNYTGSQNVWGWKELLEVIVSKCLQYQTGPSKAMCPGPCPDSLLISDSKDGDSTISLDSLCQDIIVLTMKKSVLMFKGNLPCFSVCPLPLVLWRAQLEIAWFHLLYTFPSHNDKIPLSLPFSWLELFSLEGWSRSLNILVAFCWTLSSNSFSPLFWGTRSGGFIHAMCQWLCLLP